MVPDLLVRHIQYNGCWWPGDAGSQAISSQGSDPDNSAPVSCLNNRRKEISHNRMVGWPDGKDSQRTIEPFTCFTWWTVLRKYKKYICISCSRTAETGSHLCVSAMTGELPKAPKRWWGNFICASKMASRFVPSDVSFGDIRHHSVSSC